ncbi:hypothetical protein AB0M36_08730 [Actinoplanes sp. NPDC051346]|uniref:hypothetical protein n=1 Tax=Actinoplanes sp. NPDC051346 TaxID=3155048 RepID=UPI00343057E3
MTLEFVLLTIAGHSPLLAVLIAGLALLSARRARLGPRSVTLARLGLSVLLVSKLLSLLWDLAFPLLMYSPVYLEQQDYLRLTRVVSIVVTLLSAAGLAVLIAAVLARAQAGGAPTPGPFGAPVPSALTPENTAFPVQGPAGHQPPTTDQSTDWARPS